MGVSSILTSGTTAFCTANFDGEAQPLKLVELGSNPGRCTTFKTMFEDIQIYMTKTREERRAHLQLSTPCIKIGGYDSREYRGLLAHFLKTTIPTKTVKKISLCHGCNEHGCSNVLHLYWGSSVDNTQDMKDAGTWKSQAQKMEEKYTPEELKRIRSEAGRKGGQAKRKHSIP